MLPGDLTGTDAEALAYLYPARRPKKIKNALAPTGPKSEAIGKCLQSVRREAPALVTQSELFGDLS